MSSTAKLLIKGSSFRVIKTLVSIFVGFLMMPFLLNNLGEHLYGLWITIGSVVGVYYLLDLGFSQAVTRYVAKCIHQTDYLGANRIINTALVIYTLLGAFVLLLSVVIAKFAIGNLVSNTEDLGLIQVLVVIAAISLAFEFPTKAFPGIINAYMRYDTTALVAVIKTVADAILIYLFIKNGYGLIAMSLIVFSTSLLSTIFYVFYCNRLFKNLEYKREHVEMGTAREIFHYSKWVFVMDLNRMLKEKMDIWFIAYYLSMSSLAVYYVAVRLVEYAGQMLVQATGMSGTLFTKYYALADNAKLAWTVAFFIKINVFAAGLILCGFYCVGESFIRLWMGKDFDASQAYIVLLVMGLGKLTTFMSSPFAGLLLTLKRHSFTAKLSLFESIASAILCLTLIPRFGLPGAAISIAAPLVVGRLFILSIFSSRFVAIDYKELMPRLLSTLAFMAIVTYAMKRYLPEVDGVNQLLVNGLGLTAALSVCVFFLFEIKELKLALNFIKNYKK